MFVIPYSVLIEALNSSILLFLMCVGVMVVYQSTHVLDNYANIKMVLSRGASRKLDASCGDEL